MAMEKFHMPLSWWLPLVPASEITEYEAYFILEAEDRDSENLANKSRMESKQRAHR